VTVNKGAVVIEIPTKKNDFILTYLTDEVVVRGVPCYKVYDPKTRNVYYLKKKYKWRIEEISFPCG